jgi:AraC family transcriptional regulator
MDYKIVDKDAFTVMGASRMFKYDTAFAEIPKFWDEHFDSGKGKAVCGMYGVCIEDAGKGEFEYLIADNYMLLIEEMSCKKTDISLIKIYNRGRV